MTIDSMLAEALLDGYVGTLRGTKALLAFWRVWRQAIPQHAAITDAQLAELEQARTRPVFRFDPATGVYGYGPPDDPGDEIAVLHRRRAVWERICAILDQPDDAALDALYALVNGPDAAELMPFYVTLAQPPGPPDPIYADYLKHFYQPYARHARPRLQAAAAPEAATATGEVPPLKPATTPDSGSPSPSPAFLAMERAIAGRRPKSSASETAIVGGEVPPMDESPPATPRRPRRTIRVGGLHPPPDAPESKTPLP